MPLANRTDEAAYRADYNADPTNKARNAAAYAKARAADPEKFRQRWLEQRKGKAGLDSKFRTRQRNGELRDFVNAIKVHAGCTDCGYNAAPEALDFDHVRGMKVKQVSYFMNNGVITESLIDEIKKCEVVCANCHRVRTRRRLHGD